MTVVLHLLAKVTRKQNILLSAIQAAIVLPNHLFFYCIFQRTMEDPWRRCTLLELLHGEDRQAFIVLPRDTAIRIGPYPDKETVRRIITAAKRVGAYCRYITKSRGDGSCAFNSHLLLCRGGSPSKNEVTRTLLPFEFVNREDPERHRDLLPQQ